MTIEWSVESSGYCSGSCLWAGAGSAPLAEALCVSMAVVIILGEVLLMVAVVLVSVGLWWCTSAADDDFGACVVIVDSSCGEGADASVAVDSDGVCVVSVGCPLDSVSSDPYSVDGVIGSESVVGSGSDVVGAVASAASVDWVSVACVVAEVVGPGPVVKLSKLSVSKSRTCYAV